MNYYRLLFSMVILVMLSGCFENRENVNDPIQEAPNETKVDVKKGENSPNLTETNQISHNPEEVADEIVKALHDKNMDTFAHFVHPTKGVRFTPYAYVQIDVDQVFKANQIGKLLQDQTVYHWGAFDGTGDPIEMTFAEYFQRFVYDQEYLHAEEKSVNERLGHGNSLDNISEVYPNATVIEYYFSGFDPQYEGMDWRSLRLVLEKDAGVWYLIGIVHDEWTS